jgi:hypothetical protein
MGRYAGKTANDNGGGFVMFNKNRRLAFRRYFFVWIALLWSPELFAVGPEEFRTTFVEQLAYQPAKYLGVEWQGMDAETIDQRLSQLYHENDLQPLWVNTDGPGERAKAILDALRASDNHGLNPENYYIDKIEKHWNRTDAVGLVRLDILLSFGLRGYVGDMREGRIGPHNVDPKLFATARDVEIDWKSLMIPSYLQLPVTWRSIGSLSGKRPLQLRI